MKGIVFNLLERIVSDELGEEMWERLLEATRSKGAYTSLGNYPDAEIVAFVKAAAQALGKTDQEVLRWFGRACIPHFAERYPALFSPHRTARSFVLTLNDIIHPEVRKLYPGADVPVFDFATPAPDRVDLGYVSKRRMCAFAEGLLEGAARHFGEAVELAQSKCMLRGDPKCVLACRFVPAESPA